MAVLPIPLPELQVPGIVRRSSPFSVQLKISRIWRKQEKIKKPTIIEHLLATKCYSSDDVEFSCPLERCLQKSCKKMFVAGCTTIDQVFSRSPGDDFEFYTLDRCKTQCSSSRAHFIGPNGSATLVLACFLSANPTIYAQSNRFFTMSPVRPSRKKVNIPKQLSNEVPGRSFLPTTTTPLLGSSPCAASSSHSPCFYSSPQVSNSYIVVIIQVFWCRLPKFVCAFLNHDLVQILGRHSSCIKCGLACSKRNVPLLMARNICSDNTENLNWTKNKQGIAICFIICNSISELELASMRKEVLLYFQDKSPGVTHNFLSQDLFKAHLLEAIVQARLTFSRPSNHT